MIWKQNIIIIQRRNFQYQSIVRPMCDVCIYIIKIVNNDDNIDGDDDDDNIIIIFIYIWMRTFRV